MFSLFRDFHFSSAAPLFSVLLICLHLLVDYGRDLEYDPIRSPFDLPRSSFFYFR